MISVIIVNYNSACLTKRAMESVFREGEDVEIFVVDNTATTEERRSLQDMFEKQDVTLLFNETNAGFARACNQAFSLARGEFVFLLNPDAYLVRPCLGILREFMETTPRAGSVSPILYWDRGMTYLFPNSFPPSPVQDFCMKLSNISQSFGCLYSQCGKRKNLKLWRSSLPVRVKNLSGGTVMLRRSTVEDIGGLFDEQFFMFYEDNDLFLRLRKAGYSLHFIPRAKAVHSYKHTILKLDVMARSRELYYNKHFSSHFLRYISARLPDNSRKTGYTDSGTWVAPPSFSVPRDLRKGYLFEWSPNHLFIPSVGFFGSGETFIFSEEIWNSLDEGDYYVRFSDYRKRFCTGETLLLRKAKQC